MEKISEHKTKRRGFDENDDKWFSRKAVELLQTAREEIVWLLDRGYKISSVLDLVGGHYQLSARQRQALQRACCSTTQSTIRKRKEIPLEALRNGCIYIDGFNLIITLEVALSGSILLLGTDGCIRDMAGLRGTYRLIDKTDKTLDILGNVFREIRPEKVQFFLDAPVSNSGRLKLRILEKAEVWNTTVAVDLIHNPDTVLSKLDKVVTSDSVILDSCISWSNLSRWIIENNISDANIVDLSMYKA